MVGYSFSQFVKSTRIAVIVKTGSGGVPKTGANFY